MPVEVCRYRLTHKSKPVGSHELKTFHRGRVMLLEGRAQFQGALGNTTIAQRSRCAAGRCVSQRFREHTTERSGERTLDILFDPEQGLVTATRGRDKASSPYIRPYRDPLSLLLELRGFADAAPVVVPMLGRDVTVQRVGEVELDTALGTRTAVAYLLHPGGSVVYVDRQPPHLLLKLRQRLRDGHVDATLVAVGEENELEDFGVPSAGGSPRRGGGKRRRRSRRRRPRRGKSRE